MPRVPASNSSRNKQWIKLYFPRTSTPNKSPFNRRFVNKRGPAWRDLFKKLIPSTSRRRQNLYIVSSNSLDSFEEWLKMYKVKYVRKFVASKLAGTRKTDVCEVIVISAKMQRLTNSERCREAFRKPLPPVEILIPKDARKDTVVKETRSSFPDFPSIQTRAP